MTLNPEQVDTLWQRVSSLRPMLRSNVVIQPQEYRGVRWYMLQDQSSGRFCRINDLAYAFVGRLDGNLSVSEVVELTNRNSDETNQLQADDVLALMAHLHDIEVLKGGLPVSLGESLSRYNNSKRQKFKQSWGNPLAIKVALFDPEKLLEKLAPFARLVFSKVGLYVWLCISTIALVALLFNGDSLYASINALTFSGTQIVLIWLLYPLIKALHELGHGLATKAWGGEVHEAGIMFLLFMPVPYVDASASWAFRDRRKRALVAASGILVELAIASLGLIIWSMTSPGIVNALALNALLIGGVSTLLYNGNPLLRFDGYYVLEDLLQIPNLSVRSSRYYVYIIQRYVLGLDDAKSPVTAYGERRWFLLYGLLSPAYRLLVLFGIAFYLGSHFMAVGVVLASWAVYMQIGKPLYSACQFLFTSQRLQSRRIRSNAVTVLFLGCISSLLLVPMPLVSRIEGVVWLSESSHVYAQTDGMVETAYVRSGTNVEKGEPLLALRNDDLNLELLQAKMNLAELQTRLFVAQKNSRIEGAIAKTDITSAKAAVADLEQRKRMLNINSTLSGRIVYKDPHRLEQKYVSSGDTIGYIVANEQPLVRAVIDQNRVHLLDRELVDVELVIADQIEHIYSARLEHQVPASSKALPSAALGTAGGGKIPIDPADESGTTAAQEVYQLDFRLPEGAKYAAVGTRAYVRLIHGKEPLMMQWGRDVRQLFIAMLPN